MTTTTTGPRTATTSAPPFSPRATERQRLDDALDRLRQGCRRFARLSLGERIALARSMQSGYMRVARRSVLAACQAKGIVPGTPREGQEWATGPCSVVRHLRLVLESLTALRRTGNTPVGRIDPTQDGRLSVRVFPGNAVDGLLFKGVTAEVHLRPGVEEARMHASRAAFYKNPEHEGRVTLVLGAGNIAAIVSHDLITKMFNEGKGCIVKMNPVNAYLGPFLEEAFAEPIAKNFLGIVYGGANEGEYLAHHAAVDEVHLTGSDRTFDRLVWGAEGPERDERKRLGTPVLGKPITAELGNVSPVLVVPGPYTERELLYQAEDVASAFTFNASFLCNASKVLVTPGGWPLRERLLSALEGSLSRTDVADAYYPETAERWNGFTAGHSDVRTFGKASNGGLPWTLVPGLDPSRRDQRGFSVESFCPVLFETQVGSPDPVEFLEAAVSFANDRLWGTLSAGLVVHPQSLRDPMVAAALERAISRLRYGTVCLNAWSGLSFSFAAPPWGGHPSSRLDDIQSGRGWVHNTSMLEGIEKVVLRHPLTARPKPGYFASHRTAHAMMPRLMALEERARWSKVPAVVAAAMRA